MKIPARTLQRRTRQQGALIILTLLILLVISILGMATIDSSGLEMKMSSNSRIQQEAFEAAEYTLSWVENDIVTSGYFSDESVRNISGCGNVCFSDLCGNGYCFSGSFVDDIQKCVPVTTPTEPYERASLWADGSGQFRTLDIPNSDITAKYIVEFWCYTAANSEFAKDGANFARTYRITAFAVGEGGKARAMLRSTIKQI